MRVDDIAFGDVEYLIRWYIQECESRQVEVRFEELVSYVRGVQTADEHGLPSIRARRVRADARSLSG